MTPEQSKAYQAMFDAFVQKHKLDIELDNWPAELEAEWDRKVARFMQKNGIPSA